MTADITHNEMLPDWESLPLLSLRCILDHLSTEDAMAAMSVCRHWRSAVLLYEGRKQYLKLEAQHLDKCLYVTRLFKKYTKALYIILDCNEEELDKFMSYVLPQYFDTVNLIELIIVGPRYLQLGNHSPVVKLRRIIIESLIHKHFKSLRKIAFLGCEMGETKNENDRFIHKHIEYYSRPLTFPSVTAPGDAILVQANAAQMHFSSIRRIIVDYDQINTEALETLAALRLFCLLSLNVFNKEQAFQVLDWERIYAYYPNGLAVNVNLIAVPPSKMKEVILKVLRPGMMLTSFKVLYCKTVCLPLIEHVVRLYKRSINELVWADCPHNQTDPYSRQIHSAPLLGVDSGNPFVLLCWQCKKLRRLVIHGYWVWQYDLLGFARLRKSLTHLEVSSIHERQDLFSANDAIVRVLATDAPQEVPENFIKEMNEYTCFAWKPIPWGKLHPGLGPRAGRKSRASYLMYETVQHLAVTCDCTTIRLEAYADTQVTQHSTVQILKRQLRQT